ncbi:MAG TPA: hypothetical protein VNO34_01625 [Actinomycetota bacterium]|nr:hypothetical protein [Actinomycetota bacterium]
MGDVASALGAGWGPAVRGALVTVLVLGLLGELAAFLVWAGLEGDRPSPVTFARLGGALFLSFHRVGFSLGLPERLPPSFGEVGLSGGTLGVTLALVTGTVLACWVLGGYGAAVGDRTGGSRLARGLHGAKLGLPYALVGLVVALGVGFAVGLDGLSLSVRPSRAGAFWWPLLLGTLFGFLGGFLSLPERWGDIEAAWSRRLRGALSGGVSAAFLALGLALIGLLFAAAARPEATRAYFRAAFAEGTLQGVAAVGLTALAAGNLAAWVLFPSMGSCLTLSAGLARATESVCLLAYSQFPSASAFRGLLLQGAEARDLPAASPPHLAFLLVPLASALLGGAMAARRAGAEGRLEAAGVGAASGLVFAVLSLVLAVLSTASLEFGAPGAEPLTVRLGPSLPGSFVVALLWGVAGGAAGGLLGRRPPWGPGLELPPLGPPPGY